MSTCKGSSRNSKLGEESQERDLKPISSQPDGYPFWT